MERKKVRCDTQFNFLCPQALVTAVQAIAAARYQSANSYVRGALVQALQRDGQTIEGNERA